jgi:lipoprotein signal peptidase
MAERSYRWLLWSLVLLGIVADQAAKYVVFKWQYPVWKQDKLINQGDYLGYEVLGPGIFYLHADYTDKEATRDSVLTPLQTWSSDTLPKVNHGALFGFLSHRTALANGLFATVSILAALAIGYWSGRPSLAHDRYLCVALGLILAGTLGNLYDRLVFGGVRDFLYFKLIEWPVFNLADCCLVFGAALLLTQALWNRSPAVPSAREQTALSAAAADAE